MSREPDILAACAALSQATADFEEAKKAVSQAQEDERAAGRRLSRMQHDFDIMYSRLRSHAPVGSHWDTIGDFFPPPYNEL